MTFPKKISLSAPMSIDPTRFINDLFRQNPDGSWSNGAPSMDGPPVYRH